MSSQQDTGQLAQLQDRERQLVEELRRRLPVARNVNELHTAGLSFGDRVADGIASVMGSWRFIIVQSALLTVWIGVNVFGWIQRWDPYPFILLNLMLSFQAAYAAPIIMMSQNRQEAKDRVRSEHDYEVNLKAEAEIVDLHTKLDALRSAQWDALIELQRRQISLLEQLTAAATPESRRPDAELLG
jgi:uncharacterized membrane protein